MDEKEMLEAITKAVDEKEENFTLKLSKKQIYVVLASLAFVVGGIFGLGVKSGVGIKNIEITDINIAHKQEIAKVECEKIVLEREKLVVKEEAEFFKGRYLANQKRLKDCIDKTDYTNIFSKSDEIYKEKE